MSRLNYLTDEELAIVGIDQDLMLLERLVADGLKLSVNRRQTLANYKGRISSLMANEQNRTETGEDDVQTVRPASLRSHDSVGTSSEIPSIETLRETIRELLDEALDCVALPDLLLRSVHPLSRFGYQPTSAARRPSIRHS